MPAYNYQKVSELVHLVKLKDGQAFADLYSMTYQRVYFFSMSILRDEHLAEDAVQETYIRALKSKDSLHDDKLFIAWLNKITYSICLRILSKRKNDQSFDEIENQIEDTGQSQDPLLKAVESESHRNLMRHILDLPDSYKAVILMKYYENMKLNEIAVALDIPPGTVKSRIHTAKKMLRDAISKKGDDQNA